MDILHVNRKEINEMGIDEYLDALQYSCFTYFGRDVMFCLSEFLKTQDKQGKGEGIDWTPLNPVEQALRQRKIPDNFLEMISKK